MINKEKINKVIFKVNELKNELTNLNYDELKYLKLYSEIKLKLDELEELEKKRWEDWMHMKLEKQL